LQGVVRVRKLVRLGNPAGAVGGREEETVVRADVQPAHAVAESKGATTASHTRVDHGEMDPHRHVGERVRQHERALEDVPRADPVRDVDDAGFGGDGRDDAVAGADEVVL
jgi:hypothetical protein